MDYSQNLSNLLKRLQQTQQENKKNLKQESEKQEKQETLFDLPNAKLNKNELKTDDLYGGMISFSNNNLSSPNEIVGSGVENSVAEQQQQEVIKETVVNTNNLSKLLKSLSNLNNSNKISNEKIVQDIVKEPIPQKPVSEVETIEQPIPKEPISVVEPIEIPVVRVPVEPFIPQKGSVDYLNKLNPEWNINAEDYKATFDEQGRVVFLSPILEKEVYAPDGSKITMIKNSGTQYAISYNDEVGEVTVQPSQVGLVGGAVRSYTYNDDMRLVRENISNPSLGPSGWKEEIIYNKDGSSVSTRVYNDAEMYDGVKKVVIQKSSSITVIEEYDEAGKLLETSTTEYSQINGKIVSTKGIKIVKANKTTFINGVEISGKNGEDVEVRYFIDKNGHCEIIGDNLNINPQEKLAINEATIIKEAELDVVDQLLKKTSIGIENITIKGNNNNITGTSLNDSVEVIGDNNVINLKDGDDSLIVKGENNIIKNVEDLITKTWLVPAGEKGSLEYVAKLLGVNPEIIINPSYDEEGRIISFNDSFIYAGGGSPLYTVSYDDYSTIVKSTHENVEIGKVIKEKVFDVDGKLRDSYETKYNLKGNISYGKTTTNYGEYANEVNYGYDENGNMTSVNEKQFINGMLSSTLDQKIAYDSQNRVVENTIIREDANGNLIVRIDDRTSYYKNGNINESYYHRQYADGSIEKGMSIYSEKGILVETRNNTYDANGNSITSRLSTYDDSGKLILTEGSNLIKPGYYSFVNGLSLNNPSGEAVEVTYTIDAEGALVLNADNLNIEGIEKIYSPIYKDVSYTEVNDKIDTQNVETNSSSDEMENIMADNCIVIKPMPPYSYQPIGIENITIKGNNNNITGTPADDKIEVIGNNNIVDLADGDDSLNIVGNNNKIKNVEDISMNMIDKPIGIKPGEKGSVEYLNKLNPAWNINAEDYKATFDEQGRVVLLSPILEKEVYNPDGTKIVMIRNSGTQYEISYNDEVGEVTVQPKHVGLVGGAVRSYTYNDDMRLVRENISNPSLGPSGWKEEIIYNKDGSSVSTIVYNDPSVQDGIAKTITTKYGNSNRIDTFNFDEDGNVISGNLQNIDEGTIWSDNNYKTIEEAQKAIDEFIAAWDSDYTIDYFYNGTHLDDNIIEKYGEKPLFKNCVTNVLSSEIKKDDDGSYYWEVRLSQSLEVIFPQNIKPVDHIYTEKDYPDYPDVPKFDESGNLIPSEYDYEDKVYDENGIVDENGNLIYSDDKTMYKTDIENGI